MIPREDAHKFIQEKEKIALSKKSFSQLSEEYQTLGLIISQLCAPKNSYNFNFYDLYIKAFGDDPLFNPWACKAGQKLAIILFGQYRATYIADIWDLINTLPYQRDYQRRAFRQKPDSSFITEQLSTLQGLCSTGTEAGFGNMPFSQQIQYDVYYNHYSHAYLFAVALERAEENLDEIVNDIINGEDDIGGISRNIIKALLLTQKEKNWQQVGDLLLAAQRQEGLRQTILEALDETQIGALHYIIKLILAHDLERFSSVIRAIDTWFGFDWEAPKKATVKRILTLAEQLLSDPSNIDKHLACDDYLEIYVSLWVLGLEDVDTANSKAFALLYNCEKKELKLLALYFINQTKRTNQSLIKFFEKEIGKDIEIDFWMYRSLPEYQLSDTVFTVTQQQANSLPSKGKTYESGVFSWLSYTIEPHFFYQKLIYKSNDTQLQRLAGNISDMPNISREDYIAKLFPKHRTYTWNLSDKSNIPAIDSQTLGWKRQVAHQAIVDKNLTVMATGITLFYAMDLANEEIAILESIFTRKNKYLREASIHLLMQQSESVLKNSIEKLISVKKIDQRLAALELLSLLHEQARYPDFVHQHIVQYQQRDSLNKNEAVFLGKFNQQDKQLSFSNGYGVIDYNNLTPLDIPQKIFTKKKSLSSHLSNKDTCVISQFVDEEKTVNAINQLIELFKKNANHEYQRTTKRGEIVTLLLAHDVVSTFEAHNTDDELDQNSQSNLDQRPHQDTLADIAEQKLTSLPLAEIWLQWYQQSQLNDYELYSAIYFIEQTTNLYSYHQNLQDHLKNYIPNLDKINLDKVHYFRTDSINSHIKTLLEHLFDVYVDQTQLANFLADLLEDAIASIPETLKTINLDTNEWRQQDLFWCDIIGSVDYFKKSYFIKRSWQISRYLMAQSLGYPQKITALKDALHCLPKRYAFTNTSEHLTFPLYRQGEATKDDVLLENILSRSHINILDSQNKAKEPWLKALNPPYELYAPLKKNLLEIELTRGEIETEATSHIRTLGPIDGMHYFFSVLERLGKENFDRGYTYNNNSKSSIFSIILKKSRPSQSDTFATFSEKLTASSITKERLIETACYATQWANWIGQYLKLAELESAVWWFHAHSSEYRNAEKETIISRYSNVSLGDFSIGALDIDWFHHVYNALGKTNWQLLHQASKYISDGMAHKQVKLYSAVLLGEIKITQTLKHIKDKRDKNYVRALGLVPLSKTNPENDLLKRYDLLQNFLKESNQFGAQRQESEKDAVHVGLQNLARNAGYSDSVRFSWVMEAKSAQKIMAQATVSLDDICVQLIINDNGKADLQVEKNGKKQKSIPKTYQKHKEILRLKEHKDYLTKQYSRTRLSLENAMVNEAVFSQAEIADIMQHPVVKPMLSKLVLFNKTQKQAGFWQNGQLIDAQELSHDIVSSDELMIAHPTHLYYGVSANPPSPSKQWQEFQRYLFEKQIIQPFKQVFRELYIITENEQERATYSERYQGHQIQPKKAVALLRGRGWTVNHEEGLQKVYHQEGIVASMYAMADWFSPADVEAPTLEHVIFHRIKNYKAQILKDINPIIFSEVMRDIDLVVSVAHVGGVDPQASHSTMQMRAALAKESARLFKLENVEVKQRHIIINGKLGSYNIHLGSANVSKGSLQLNIIAVQSQHRGRLFLPFMDDDPKSAEIISKMKLLAEDNSIQDPTILAQINTG